MACKNYNVVINQLDLNNASNNSDPDLDGKVFISFTDCNGEPTSIGYSTAGTYLNAFCANDDDVVTSIYWFDDLGALSFRSTATPISDCVAPTPSPSVTPSFSVTPTPSTTPLNVCNCISFTNITTGSLGAGYTACDGSQSIRIVVDPNSTIVVCGSNPGGSVGIVIDTLGTCVGKSCIPFTPTPTPSLSITPTISVTPSITPSNTPSISITPSNTPSISVTPSITPSNTVAPSMTPSPTISVSKNPSPTPLPSISKTPSISVTPSITPSTGVNPTPTPTISPSGLIPTVAGLCMTIKFGSAPSVTPSITPSITPSATPTVTPSITPSTTPSSTNPPPTPSRTPSKTPSITVSTTPSITPSKTPSITPSVTPPAACLVYYINNPLTPFVNRVYSYNVLTNTSTLVNMSPAPTSAADLTFSDTKFWTLGNLATGPNEPGGQIAYIILQEYNIVSNLNMTFSRQLQIQLPPNSIVGNARGIAYKNPTTLISVRGTSTGPYPVGTSISNGIIVELNITGNGSSTDIFTPIAGRVINALCYTTAGKLIITSRNKTTGVSYISQYSYPSGVVEFDIPLTSVIPLQPQILGGSIPVFEDNGTIYFNTVFPNYALYKINSTSPYTITPVYTNTNPPIQAASSKNNCNTVNFDPNVVPAGCNNVLYRTQNSQYYSYNFATNVSTLLNVAPNPNPTLDTSNGVPITLAHTDNKSWVYAWDTATNAMVIRESNITSTPFTSTFNRNIALPAGYKPANGLVAINDTTLVGINKVQYPGIGTNPIKDEYFVVEYNISGATAVATVKFKTPQFKKPVGGFIRTTGSSPKIIMLTQPDYAPGSNLSLSQYDYNTGQLEVLQQLTQPASPNNTGLVTANGNLYIMGFNVYKINTTFPYATTFTQSPGTQLVNASQLPSCSNVTLTPNTCYGGLPPIGVPNTVTYNGITISATGAGAATQMWDIPYNTCTLTSTPVSPNSILLGNKWQSISGTPTNFSYTMNFSQAVNNINLLMAAANGTIGQSPESFTFTSNGGTVSISSNNNCFSLINGNTITANEQGVATIGGAGTFQISAPTPFTQLTLTGPGGLGGTLMSIDCTNLLPAQIVSPSPTPTPTPSISSGTPTLGCVYYNNSNGLQGYNVLTNTSFGPITMPNLGAVYSQNDTHTLTKYWKSNNTNLLQEWIPTNNPTTLAFNRNISLNTGYVSIYYASAINDTTLLAVGTMVSQGGTLGFVDATLIRIDITNNTVTPTQVTPLFAMGATTGQTSLGFGSMLLTSTNKILFVATRLNNNISTTVIYQYSYPDGALERIIDLSTVVVGSGYGQYVKLFESNGNIYFAYNAQPTLVPSTIYQINPNSPFNITQVATIPGLNQGFNSSTNCNTVNFSIDPAPSPSPNISPSPTPSLTPPVSPNVGVNTIYKYLDIL
jgi:hypothetical protein